MPDLVDQSGFISDGDWVESKDQDSSGSIRLTQLADIGDGWFRDRSRRFLRPDQAARLRCTFLVPGDVLIARMPDPLGRACVFPGLPQPAVTVVDVCIVRTNGVSISPRWLVAFLNSPEFRITVAGEQRGSTRKRITKRVLCELRLPVPPTNEQTRIADELDSYLSRLDAAVASLEHAQARVKAYRAAVLSAAVEGRLVATEAELARREEREYEPAGALLDRILAGRRRHWEEAELARLTKLGRAPKDDRWKVGYEEPEPPDTTDLPELPVGWCWATIGQLAEVTGGLTKNAARDKLARRIAYLRVANVYANALALDDIKDIGVTEGELERVLLAPGDLLVVEGNGSVDQIGRVALWDGSISPIAHQNHLIKARFQLQLLQHWALYWLLSPGGRREVVGVASCTSGLHTLSISKVQQLPVPLAPLAEQDRIIGEVDRAVSVAENAEGSIAAALRRCARLRQGTLRWAFEGKLVDQEPTDEPAEAVLGRIRAERATGSTTRKPRARRIKVKS